MRQGKIASITNEELTTLIQNNISLKNVLLFLNLHPSSGK